MADDKQEKTEQPTPKRLEEARQKGNVAKSLEVNSAVGLLAGLTLMYVVGIYFVQKAIRFFYLVFNGGYQVHLTPQNVYAFFQHGLLAFGPFVLAFMIGMLLVGLAASIGQVGFVWSLEPLKFNAEKLNPFKNFQKIMFSSRTLEELLKNSLKLLIVVYISYKAISSYKTELVPLQDQTVAQIAHFMIVAGLKISFKVALAFLLIAGADYAFQRYEYIRNLRMTKQEVKDEYKQTEGDPKVKSRIRARQMQIAMRRMMAKVPEADVVITNPTHFAVALQYEPSKMSAPRVIAKGQDRIALRIREIAEEHEIPIVEDPPLARALYQAVELDAEIPEAFFQAVAEVLAYVYKLKNKTLS